LLVLHLVLALRGLTYAQELAFQGFARAFQCFSRLAQSCTQGPPVQALELVAYMPVRVAGYMRAQGLARVQAQALRQAAQVLSEVCTSCPAVLA
jgi:hypothetical protein